MNELAENVSPVCPWTTSRQVSRVDGSDRVFLKYREIEIASEFVVVLWCFKE